MSDIPPICVEITVLRFDPVRYATDIIVSEGICVEDLESAARLLERAASVARREGETA